MFRQNYVIFRWTFSMFVTFSWTWQLATLTAKRSWACTPLQVYIFVDAGASLSLNNLFPHSVLHINPYNGRRRCSISTWGLFDLFAINLTFDHPFVMSRIYRIHPVESKGNESLKCNDRKIGAVQGSNPQNVHAVPSSVGLFVALLSRLLLWKREVTLPCSWALVFVLGVFELKKFYAVRHETPDPCCEDAFADVT